MAGGATKDPDGRSVGPVDTSVETSVDRPVDTAMGEPVDRTADKRVDKRVDIVDDTFIRAAPGSVRAFLDEPGLTRLAWPDLELEVVRDRGAKGLRWTVTGAIVGSMEVWLEPWRDGVIVHHYVRGRATSRSAPSAARRHATRWKSVVHAAKDELEGRPL